MKALDDFAARVLMLEAPGGSPERLMVTIPATIGTGEPFDARLSLLDEHAMPSLEGGTVELHVPGGESRTVTFAAGSPAAVGVGPLRLDEAGIVRLAATWRGETVHSNPARASDRPAACVLWGDPHVHTVLSDCHPDRCRTRALAYTVARDVYGLDWLGIADHVSYGKRGSVGKWRDNVAAADLFNAPGRFTTLPGYEASLDGGLGGDNNVYMRAFPEMYLDPDEPKWSLKQYAEQLPEGAILVPHHTTRTKKHGEIPPEIYPGPEKMPLVEVHSKWGTSEYRGNPTPLADVHPGPSTVQDFLGRGYHMGFVGGTDCHTSLTFNLTLENEHIRHEPGLTAVMATENTREALYDAMAGRACYAAAGERFLLEAAVGDLAMGQLRPATDADRRQRTVSMTVAARRSVEKVEVIRNGRVVHAIEPRDWKYEGSWEDREPLSDVALTGPGQDRPFVYYYVRVTGVDNAFAWSSPSWLTL